MKKSKLLISILSVLLMFCLCFSMNAFSKTSYASASDAEGDELLVEREEISLDDILAKINSGFSSEEYLTELPFDEDIEIFESGDDVYEEPEHLYPDNMSKEEITATIERIANGENVIFGDGVERDFSSQADNSVPEGSSEWKSGGINVTHQWLVSRGWTILKNDYPSLGGFFTSQQITEILYGADWPDTNDTGPNLLGIPTYNSHFYNYPTGTNYIWGTSPTAKSKFKSWYDSAVNKYKNSSNINEALQDLGKAIHYLSDIGSPPHTGDRAMAGGALPDPIAAFFHSCYETDADNYKSSYTVNNANYYSWYSSNTLDYIAEVNAGISYNYYSGISSTGSTYWNSVKYPLEYTQMDIAGLLYKFTLDCYTVQQPESFAFSSSSRYVEKMVSLSAGQYKDYYVTFATAGNKLIQTFGPKDAYLYLYSSSGTLLASDDDSGSGLNALINYTVSANTQYHIRVKFYSSSVYGIIKLGITPAKYVYTPYENIRGMTGTGGAFGCGSHTGFTEVLIFTPTSSGTYKIYQNNPGIDGYLYLVDPTTTDPCLYDDDSNGNLCPLITASLTANRTYFIVVSAYNLTSTVTGNITICISKI